MRTDQITPLMLRQNQVAVHQREASLSLGLLQVLAIVLCQVSDQRARIGGRREHVYEREAFLQVICALDADHATHQVDDQLRSFLFQGFKRREAPGSFILSALPHHAGIHNDHVRILWARRGSITKMLQRGCHPLRVGNVHLASGSPNVIFHVRYYISILP
jgi:hypothetical protein